MPPGLPDRVDYERLAEDAAVLQRVYPLGDLPRLQDLLADTRGSVAASFAFATLGSGRMGATVAIEANPHLVCQRCMQGFAFPVAGSSDIEFADGAGEPQAGLEREVYSTERGSVSLRDLAEEEMLLALPIVAACSTPQTCGWAPTVPPAAEALDAPGDRTRPFTGLQDLLKKT
jgi:uncharacterized protein